MIWQVLVVLNLAGVETTVEARYATDSMLELPAAETYALLGLGTPPVAWVRLDALQRSYPPVTFTWAPREMTVYVEDPNAVLPATRALRDRLTREAHGAAPYALTQSGPFLGLTGDDRGRQLWEGGYSYRGRVALQASRSTVSGNAWSVGLAPGPWLFASVSGGQHQPPAASARLAAGPAWMSTSWAQGQALVVDGLLQLGRVGLFGSSRDAFVVTLCAAPVGVQVGRTGQHVSARLTYGPVFPSPFTVPTIH